MNQIDPPPAALPTLRELNRATLVAVGAAALILIAAVLPAEYGIDLTGIGRVLGLTQMGEMKRVQAEGETAAAITSGDITTTMPDGGTQVRIVIGPYGGREVKASMKAGAEMQYEWATDGEAVEYEFHGDHDDGNGENYSSYEKGTKASAKGRFKAGFDGRHGWYWHNLKPVPVTITATVKGAVEKFAPLEAASASGGASAAKASPSAPDKTPYHAAMPMKQLMANVLSRAAADIWQRQGYVSDEKGSRSLFPKNDAEWKDVENASLALAEQTNGLLIPGRRVEAPEWDNGVIAVRKVALELAATAAKKDEDGFMEAGSRLHDACHSCHVRYAPGVE